MKNILMLDTSVATTNIGDEIINVSIKNNWEDVFKKNYIVTLPTHTMQYSLLQKVLYKETMNVFKNAEYKFLCGTNALYTNMLRPFPSWNINLFNCELVHDTVCLGVGIGENSKTCNLYTKLLYDKVLSHKYIHSVRDEKAKKFLDEQGFKVINTGCPTLWGITEEFCSTIPKEKANSVVFTLTHYLSDRTKDREMVECLKRNYEKVYFWPQCIGDLEYLDSICDSNDIIVVPANLDAYDELLSTNIDYVGNRLHGGIFAMQHRCRTIIIGIDYRLKEMRETYCLPALNREEIPEKLERMITSEWETRPIGIDENKIRIWKSQFE